MNIEAKDTALETPKPLELEMKLGHLIEKVQLLIELAWLFDSQICHGRPYINYFFKWEN